MKRFTERTIRDDYNNVDIIGVDLTKLYKELDDQQNPTLTFALNKLANLEDIEEELGIDLLTLLRALMNGIYVIDDGYIEYDSIAGMEHWGDGVVWVETSCNQLMLFKDYGKTWALTKEELEE